MRASSATSGVCAVDRGWTLNDLVLKMSSRHSFFYNVERLFEKLPQVIKCISKDISESIKSYANNLTMVSKNKLILIVLLVAGFLFYWYEYRPSKIRSDCVTIAEKNAQGLAKEKATLSGLPDEKKEADMGMYLKEDYDAYYQRCLREHGIDK
jgi:hypothetical protein